MFVESDTDPRVAQWLVPLKSTFIEQFSPDAPENVEWLLFTFAPGRVNFIGEHVDYMGGWVCPAAVLDGTMILAGRVKGASSTPSKLQFYATYTKERLELEGSLDADAATSSEAADKNWTTYVRGAVTLALEDAVGAPTTDLAAVPNLQGVCFVLHSTLEMGAGMSASAAFSVGLLHALHHVAQGAKVTTATAAEGEGDPSYQILPAMSTEALVHLAKQARRIEVEFCHVNVGIMDQFASALSQDSSFIFLDCLEYTFERFTLNALLGEDYMFVLYNTMVKHQLAAGNAGGYNQVRLDQEEAQRKIKQFVFKDEKEFTFAAFVRDTDAFNDGEQHQYTKETRMTVMEAVRPHLSEGEYERGCYQLSEQERTLAFKALQDDSQPHLTHAERVQRTGALLSETHRGLRDLLRVSTAELDFIQELLTADEGCAGARMMGAGFGGCVIALIKRSEQERLEAMVREKYEPNFLKEQQKMDIYAVDHLGRGVFSAALPSS